MTMFVPWDMPIYSQVKLAVLTEMLGAQGVRAEDMLQGTQLAPQQIQAATTKISINQMVAAYRNAAEIRPEPGAAFRIGLQTHITCYGMFGLGILSSPDFRQAIQFCADFHHLATPMVQLAAEPAGRDHAWAFKPLPHHGVDLRLYRFIVEMQIGILTSLHREMIGPGFAPTALHVDFHDEPFQLYFESEFGVPCRMGQKRNQFFFDAALLDLKNKRGNDITHAETRKHCQAATLEIENKCGLPGKIRSCMLNAIESEISFDAIANRLNIAERTLRRRLREHNTSFSELLDDVRCHAAVKYLRDTPMTLEDVAGGLGFSDAANFRHAFRRWTGVSPQEFRRRARPA